MNIWSFRKKEESKEPSTSKGNGNYRYILVTSSLSSDLPVREIMRHFRLSRSAYETSRNQLGQRKEEFIGIEEIHKKDVDTINALLDKIAEESIPQFSDLHMRLEQELREYALSIRYYKPKIK